MYERVAEEEKCLLVPDVLDGILSDAALRSDPIHPNGEGLRAHGRAHRGAPRGLVEGADKSRPRGVLRAPGSAIRVPDRPGVRNPRSGSPWVPGARGAPLYNFAPS